MERRAILAGYGELDLRVPVDRRQFVATVAAGLGTHVVAGAGQAIAQTAGTVSPSDPRPLPPESGLFKDFEAKWIRTNGADIFLRHRGTGPAILLLHGNPQTHACWHKIAQSMAKRFHVVVADLRGYGDSIGPADGGKEHVNYSFRTAPEDEVKVVLRSVSKSILSCRPRPGRPHASSNGG